MVTGETRFTARVGGNARVFVGVRNPRRRRRPRRLIIANRVRTVDTFNLFTALN